MARYCTNWPVVRTILLSLFENLHWAGFANERAAVFLCNFSANTEHQPGSELQYDPSVILCSLRLFLLCEYIREEQKDTQPLPVIHFF